MGELKDCPTCGSFFNYTGIRDVCGKCATNEEKLYEDVYKFLRRRENRAATIERIVEVTGVTENLLHKWVRKGRLQPALFPNLGYPCDKCGALTTKGKLCDACTTELHNEIRTYDAALEFREAVKKHDDATYHIDKKPERS